MQKLLTCITCGKSYESDQPRFNCECGGLLDLTQDLEQLGKEDLKTKFDERVGSNKLPDASGVWRYRELLFDTDKPISRFEGNTRLYPVSSEVERPASILMEDLEINLYFKHEGENPSASFKDRGMCVAITAGADMGCRNFVCASTGNTSASLASYCTHAGLNGIVLIPDGKIAYGKLSQALAYGAKVLQVKGNFDDSMRLVQELGNQFDPAKPEESFYVLNSVNPFRIEGQKTIAFEIFQQLDWVAPDWIVLPAGNVGNTSAFGKAINEAYELGLIDKKPRIAAVQATGANPFYTYYKNGWENFQAVEDPDTIATAIKIGNPISYPRARRAIETTNGVVLEATENEILDAKAAIDAAGIGCEPASACSLAGIRQLIKAGEIKAGQTVVGILTGHLLKDPDATINYHLQKLEGIEARRANQPVQIEAKVEAVLEALKK